jgi:hypothetical protein
MAKLAASSSRRTRLEARRSLQEDPGIPGAPDVEHDWDDWLRMWLEEVFVTDAPAIYPRKTKGGELYALEHIDGATIKRILNADGRTPLPPDPAYAQVIKGITAANYTTEELYYLPRNVRVSPDLRLLAGRADHHDGEHRASPPGASAELLHRGQHPADAGGVPATWNVEQIEKFQKVWDAMMSGDLAKLQKARFVPGELKTQSSRRRRSSTRPTNGSRASSATR